MKLTRKSADSATSAVSREMQMPVRSPMVAASSTTGIGMTSKSRTPVGRSSGTRSRKPAIIPSLPSRNHSSGVFSDSFSGVSVSFGSRSSGSTFSRADRVSSEEKASEVGSSSLSKILPPPE